MKLRGIGFGPVHYASGTGGFLCDRSEYWHHRVPFLAPNFTGATKTTKTVTLLRRDTESGANMDLDAYLRPTERFPRCIAVNPFACCSVNAVGLANEGLPAHLDRDIWQKWEESFFISLMAVGGTLERRRSEWDEMFYLLAGRLHEFKALFAIQVNLSCPNAGHDPRGLTTEAVQVLDSGARRLPHIPFVPKFNVQHLSRPIIEELQRHPACDAILVSNTVPWNELPKWVRILSFGSIRSPLRRRNFAQDGGYAGPYLLPLVERKVREMRRSRFTKPVIACGGITKPKDVDRVFKAGADAVEFATVAMLRPWRVQPIIKRAHELWG